ncbi:MAG: LPS export ABC transporter periplasmic protein LptC [Candidatus Cloacimonetes bacterium]|nr:LPS export ABC transporter periplasmic protein LptC [Candidatus Cloacimonadota bacterium]
MIKQWKNLWHILRIVNLFFLILFFSCTKSEDMSYLPIEDKIPDEQADSIRIIATTNDVIDYELIAVRMFKYYETKQTFADTVFITFYNPDATIKSTLSCDRAELDDAKNILTGIGNVIVKSENGIMKAPYMVLNRNTNKIFAQRGVTMIRGENVLHGAEMKTDLYLDRVEILEVTAEGKLDEKEIKW